MFPFQEECFNPPFPLFVTRRVMTPSTLFARHTFQIRLCQPPPPPPRPNCAFVYLKTHQMIGPPIPAQMAVDAKSVTTPTCTAATLHRVTGPPILKPSQKFHSSGVPHHRVDQRNKKNKQKKEKIECSRL